MASLDAWFFVKADDESIVQAMFAASRRRARSLGVREFRSRIYRGNPPLLAHVAVHGNTYVLDIFIERLRRDLPTIAEATPAKRRPSSRRDVALGLVEILTRYRFDMYERYGENWAPTLRARKKPAHTLPHSLWVQDAALGERLSATNYLMASWHYEEVEPAVLLEELHTAAELILCALVGRSSRNTSFAQLTELAYQHGFLGPYGLDSGALRPGSSALQHFAEYEVTRRDLLISLKNLRRDVRHRGSVGAKDWLDTNFWDLASLLESMALHVK